MQTGNAHEVLKRLADLEVSGADDLPEEEVEALEEALRALPPGSLDAALGDIPEDFLEEDEDGSTEAEPGVADLDDEDDFDRPLPVELDSSARTIRGDVWENWSKNYRARQLDFKSPRTEGELVRAVQEVADAHGTLKPLGAGYSCSKTSQPFKRGTAIDTQRYLNRLLPVVGLKRPEEAKHLVRVEAGIRLDRLARTLAKQGLALPNMGGFDKQTLAGVMSTGTHGTGLDQSTFADAVASVDIVVLDENGRANVHRFEPTDGITDPRSFPQADQFLHQNDDEFYAMVVSCGMVGVVYAYTLRAVELYFVRETNEKFVFPDDFDKVLARAKKGENLSIVIHPNATLGKNKHIGLLNRFERLSKAEVDAIDPGLWKNPPPRPTQRNFLEFIEGIVGTKFVGWYMATHRKFVRRQIEKYMTKSAGESFLSVYYRVYPRPTGDRFRAVFNEFSVPLDDLKKSMTRVLKHAEKNWKKNDLLYQVPFALRFVGASKHFISMHHGRDSGTIEAFALRGSRRPITTLRALEKVLIDSRPHWGQLHFLESPPMVQYPDSWDAFFEQYKRWNKSGVFNSPMTAALGISQKRTRPTSARGLDRLARETASALADDTLDGDLDEKFPQLAELLADEEARADLLPHLSRAAGMRTLSRGPDIFENWLGEGDVSVANIIDDAEDLDDLEARLVSTINPVRLCGKRHSDNRVALPDPGSLVVDLSNWRIKRSAGNVTDSPCNPTKKSNLVRAPYEKHETNGRRFVRMFAWETLQDIAERGADDPGGDPAERFALINSGSFTHQTLAGPLSVGTHGSGASLGAMCDPVAAIDILSLDGKVYRVSREGTDFPLDEVVLPDGRGKYTPVASRADFKASVVNLGTLGVALSYWVQVRDFYWLTQSVETKLLNDALDWVESDLEKSESAWRHVELLLMPERVGGEFKCSLIRRKECLENSPQKGPPGFPGIVRRMQCNPEATEANAITLSRVKLARKVMYKNALAYQEQGDGDTGPWSQVLIRNTSVPAHGFEIAVPSFQARRAVQCVLEGIAEAGKGIGKRRCKPTSPIGVRFVAASEQYLAMSQKAFSFRGRSWEAEKWCFIEVPRLVGTIGQTRIPEEIVERLESRGVFFRLHWGQYAPPGSRNAAREYPGLRNWLGSRIAFGAGPRLLTDELCQALGMPAPPRFAAPPSRSVAAPHAPALASAALVSSPGGPERAPSTGAGRRPLVLCVHGIGDHRSGEWHQEWSRALSSSLAAQGIAEPRFVFVSLDDLFENDELSLGELGEAALQFASSFLRYRGARSAGRSLLDSAGYWLEWIPGMVAKWAGDARLRAALRKRVAGAIKGHKPELILAHSLGSLVCYDTLTHASTKSCTSYRSAELPAHFVSFGSQIGHPSVRFVWGGRIVMPQADTWTHLYNPQDEIFTAPIRLADSRFCQWTLPDVQGGVLEQHAATSYLGHAPAISSSLVPLLNQTREGSGSTTAPHAAARRQFSDALRRTTLARSNKRALLVGINRHADPSWNLEGCVNDVYRMSEVLQTRFGYQAENIRLLLDERATAAQIRERMEWLLEDANDESQRLFYYSGHGARIPGYNALEQVDQQDEALVAHDFSWQDPSTALVDDEFMELYAQLPYEAQFCAIFDCCHAGGMSRAGGTNVRGLTPPDDIRHRLLEFSGEKWRPRAGWEEKGDAVRAPHATVKDATTLRRSFLGASRGLRSSREQFVQARTEREHWGPYMPVLLYACAETELAFEHRAGTRTHGAFTYALTEYLSRSKQTDLSFIQLAAELSAQVKALGYNQSPTAEGPRESLGSPFKL